MNRQDFARLAAQAVKDTFPHAELLMAEAGDDGDAVYLAFKLAAKVHISACLPVKRDSGMAGDSISSSDTLFVNISHGPELRDE